MTEESEPRTRILVCEDERIVALDMKVFLERSGYEVPGLYASAEDLLADVESIRPDLVLMDVHLQGIMDGVEAAAILFERWAVPVILLTAYADSLTIERAKLTHPYAYILKPYDERELKTAISIGLFRASMERRLRESEARYRGLFEAGIAASFLIDSSGAIIETNRAFQKLAPEARSVSDFFADKADCDSLFESMGAGNEFGLREVGVSCAEGSAPNASWALFSAAPITLADESPAYQCQAVDVTERKSLLDQLVHAQKLSALGRFAGGVAHDFNNVLTAVLGYARLLRSDLEESGKGVEDLDGIVQAVKRAAEISRQLLVFSRRGQADLSVFTLSEMARGLERMLRRMIGDGVALVMRPSSGDDAVKADRTRLEQAVVNLVANARDAMGSGGRVLVLTGSVHTDADTAGVFGVIPAGDWSFIEVRDEGTGIPPELVRKVFEPFFTTKPPERGTGLGLSTVAGIVHQADGHITLSSKEGHGTTIRLYFPEAAIASGVEKDASLGPLFDGADGGVPRAHFNGSGMTVLLVENDDSVRAILEVLLDKSGFRVCSAGHPGEALLIVEQPASRPDLLIADMMLPLLRGPELASRLRVVVPGLPVLYLRAREGEGADIVDDASPALEAYLDKPFDENALIIAISALLGRAKAGPEGDAPRDGGQ